MSNHKDLPFEEIRFPNVKPELPEDKAEPEAGTWPTPEQWLDGFLARDRKYQLKVAESILDGWSTARRCVETHRGLVTRLDQQKALIDALDKAETAAMELIRYLILPQPEPPKDQCSWWYDGVGWRQWVSAYAVFPGLKRCRRMPGHEGDHE